MTGGPKRAVTRGPVFVFILGSCKTILGHGQLFFGLRSHGVALPFSICPAGRAAPRRLPLRPGAAPRRPSRSWSSGTQ
jgi:hypothetical protein